MQRGHFDKLRTGFDTLCVPCAEFVEVSARTDIGSKFVPNQ